MKVEEMPSAKRPEPWIKQSACCDVFIIEKKHRLSKWIDKFVNSYLTRLALLRRMRSGLLFCWSGSRTALIMVQLLYSILDAWSHWETQRSLRLLASERGRFVSVEGGLAIAVGSMR